MPNGPTDRLPLVRAVRPLLQTRRFGQPMKGFSSANSTNTQAAEWAREGTSEGSVVVTEYQTAGRGRHGRTWSADAEMNLLFSVVLRPDLPADRLGLITIAAAVAVAETVEAYATPLRATIKWPNDVLLRARKCCGILLESVFSRPSQAPPDAVILGVGLNVNQNDFPAALRDTATSIKQAAHRPIERPPLFADLLLNLERRYQSLADDEGESVRAAYENRLHRLGQSVTLRITDTNHLLRGVVRGIADDGALRLETPEGLQIVHAGEVTSR